MKNTSRAGKILAPEEVRKETQALWKQNQLRCGWFIREDLVPETHEDLVRCLQLLARHGDRATFVMARKLQRCL